MTQSNWNPHTLLVKCKMIQPFWKEFWKFLKILNIELTCDVAILFQIYMLKKGRQMATQRTVCEWL